MAAIPQLAVDEYEYEYESRPHVPSSSLDTDTGTMSSSCSNLGTTNRANVRTKTGTKDSTAVSKVPRRNRTRNRPRPLRRTRSRHRPSYYPKRRGTGSNASMGMILLSSFVIVSACRIALSSYFGATTTTTTNEENGLRGSSRTTGTEPTFHKSFLDLRAAGPPPPSCGPTLRPSEISYTLVLQLSEDRLWMMERHCRRWGYGNPISAVVYTERREEDVRRELVHRLGCQSGQFLSEEDGGSGGSLQVYWEDDRAHENENAEKRYHDDTRGYPINTLRNMALSAVKTTHVVFADVDFFLSDTAYEDLSLPVVREAFVEDSRMAVVIPAFQMTNRCRGEWEQVEGGGYIEKVAGSGHDPNRMEREHDDDVDGSVEEQDYYDCRSKNLNALPDSFDDIRIPKDFKRGKLQIFDPWNRSGQGTTNYNAWIRASMDGQERTTLLDIPCFKSNRYEPYLVFRYCDTLPPFQEAFTGYGKNKVVWAMQLRKMGYTFTQISRTFLVHYPHPPSESRTEWDRKPSAMRENRHLLPEEMEEKVPNVDWTRYKRGRVDALFVEFRTWLNEEFGEEGGGGGGGGEVRTPLCDDESAAIEAVYEDKKLWVPSKNIVHGGR